jgi:archaellum component FlaC
MRALCLFTSIAFFLSPVCAQKPSNRRTVDELKRITGQLNSIKDSNKELQRSVLSQKDQIEELNKKLSKVQSELENVSTTSNSSIATLSSENGEVSGRVGEIENTISRSNLLFVLLWLALAISGIAGFLFFFRKIAKMAVSETQNVDTVTHVDLNSLSEANARDIEFLDVLKRTYSLLRERTIPDSSVTVTLDHKLPLKVGDEIHRMRKRIENMPQEVKGLGALKNSLIRLEEEINEAGYVMVDLLGRDYDEGIICEARFVENASVPPGREIITEVLKPQINHNGQVIQVAKIEVGKSYDVAK